jgi:chaperonin GroES
MKLLSPLHDRVIVKKNEPTTVSAGGIVIPDAAAENTSKGTVVAMGPGKYSEKTGVLIPMSVQVGDEILFHPLAGSQLTIGGESYHCMPESDIWAVIYPEE